MDTHDLLVDAFGRIHETFEGVVDGLDSSVLNRRPSDDANPMGWLLWHLTRVQDDHVADLAGSGQAWEQWQDRFGLENGTDDIGYGHSSEQVAAVQVSDPSLLLGYHAEVHQATLQYLDRVDAAELDRIVDRRWDPPVTAGARLVSVLGDCLQHLGQAAYVKGLLAG